MRRINLSEKELSELKVIFRDLINYESDDPEEPIDPLTYVDTSDDNCLHIATMRNNIRAVKLLLKAGLDVNATGDVDNTPLHYAKEYASEEIIQLLLEHGAIEGMRNGYGEYS